MACFLEQHWLESAQVFKLFGKSASLDDLIGGKKYAQAVVVMREQFRQKSPDAPARQQFAELLILADRRAEAIPILLGLADEHLRFGFVEKAKDVLGRIEQLESGRPDVAQRLRRIAGLQQRPTEPEGPKDDPIEVVPEPVAATEDGSDCDDLVPVELNAFDLFPVGDGGLVSPAPLAERGGPVSGGSEDQRPIRRRASAPL
jgi:hypothetical protein